MAKQKSFEYLAVWMTLAAVVFAAFVIWAIITESTLVWLLVGAAGATLLVLGYVKWARRNAVPELPPPAPPQNDGAYRVLVVVDDGATSAAFNDDIVKAAAGKPAKAFVIAPALSSKLDRWTDDQGAYDKADANLQATLKELGALGVEATGTIGSHDPFQAAIDGLHEFPADAIVVATHDNGHANWLEKGLVERLRGVTTVPVTHVVVADG